MPVTLAELAECTGATVQGDGGTVIDCVATLQNAGPGSLSFLANPKYRKYLAGTTAAAVSLHPDDVAHCPVPALVSDNPYATYARAAAVLYPPAAPQQGVHAQAWVAETAQVAADAWIGPMAVVESGAVIGAGVQVGPGCYIGAESRVGEHSRLMANVSLYARCSIGCRALIHSGAVIGSDGFGIAMDAGRWVKVPQVGRVIIGDDVEVGANTSIDRGALEDTIIEDGVKMDNQIQVGHNVHIGAHTAIAGCVGIAGSARIGKYCGIGGGAGILGHLEIVDGVQVTPMSLVTKSVREPGIYSSGVPVQRKQDWHRTYARMGQLDSMARRIRDLEKQLKSGNE